MSADVLEHFLGGRAAPGVKDLHTAPGEDQKLSHEGPRVFPNPLCPTASGEVQSHLCTDISHLRATPPTLSPAILGEPKQPHLEDAIKTQIPEVFWFDGGI